MNTGTFASDYDLKGRFGEGALRQSDRELAKQTVRGSTLGRCLVALSSSRLVLHFAPIAQQNKSSKDPTRCSFCRCLLPSANHDEHILGDSRLAGEGLAFPSWDQPTWRLLL